MSSPAPLTHARDGLEAPRTKRAGVYTEAADRSEFCQRPDGATMTASVRKAVAEKVELVVTDQHPVCETIADTGRSHEIVVRSDRVYVRDIVHTNTIEGFWALLKRGIIGTYHNVSREYLPLYLKELKFRYNNRKQADIFGRAIAEY
jgi:ISXO2-like transposase domain